MPIGQEVEARARLGAGRERGARVDDAGAALGEGLAEFLRDHRKSSAPGRSATSARSSRRRSDGSRIDWESARRRPAAPRFLAFATRRAAIASVARQPCFRTSGSFLRKGKSSSCNRPPPDSAGTSTREAKPRRMVLRVEARRDQRSQKGRPSTTGGDRPQSCHRDRRRRAVCWSPDTWEARCRRRRSRRADHHDVGLIFRKVAFEPEALLVGVVGLGGPGITVTFRPLSAQSSSSCAAKVASASSPQPTVNESPSSRTRTSPGPSAPRHGSPARAAAARWSGDPNYRRRSTARGGGSPCRSSRGAGRARWRGRS